MRFAAPSLLGILLLLPAAAPAQPTPDLQATYQVYAAGFHVADVQATFAIGPRHYDIQLHYHTTGLVGFFRHGHEFNEVIGSWAGGAPHPDAFEATGVWNGTHNVTQIVYRDGEPVVERLEPPEKRKREPVPAAFQRNSIDTLSALALVIRSVEQTGRCDDTAHTFDGRRASVIRASTVGMDILSHGDRSIYAGRALHCDFQGRMLAGFKYSEDTPADRRPLHGTAWLAPVMAGGPPLPVMMQFQTRWFGMAHMYLTHLAPAPAQAIAEH
jgi:hypothetical protein